MAYKAEVSCVRSQLGMDAQSARCTSAWGASTGAGRPSYPQNLSLAKDIAPVGQSRYADGKWNGSGTSATSTHLEHLRKSRREAEMSGLQPNPRDP